MDWIQLNLKPRKKDLKKDVAKATEDLKKIYVTIKINDFIDLVNSKKLIIDKEELELIKSKIKIKPIIKDLTISINNSNIEKSLISTLDSYLLEIQLR